MSYRDIGQKQPSCKDCGKPVRISGPWDYKPQAERCPACEKEHERQLAAAHRAFR